MVNLAKCTFFRQQVENVYQLLNKYWGHLSKLVIVRAMFNTIFLVLKKLTYLSLNSQIPEEEKNLGPHDRLIHVYHFTKESAQNQMVLEYG